MEERYKLLRKMSVLKYYDKIGRKGTICKNGYILMCINRKRIYLHRLIWENNYGKIPIGYDVHHKDGNKLNNDISNLELISRKEHRKKHALKNNLGKDRLGCSPINKTNSQIIEKIKNLRNSGYKLKQIQQVVGLSYPTVQKYANGGK